MGISVIIPAKNEEASIRPLYSKITSVLRGSEYEIIFIDDGSTDKTAKAVRDIKDSHVRLIQFQGWFGKSAALSAGFNQAKHDIIITMDADLQDDPEEIPRLVKELGHYDIVSGWKANRKDPISKTVPSLFFNSMARFLTGVRIHDFNCGFKAYKSRVAKDLELYGELHRYIPALAAMRGYKVGEVKVRHHERRFGKSKYGFSRLLKGSFDLLTITFFMKYAKKPLHFFGLLGLLSFIAGGIIGCYLVFQKILGYSISDRPLLILCALLIIIGAQFLSLGLMAELIIRNRQVKDYVIREE